MRLSRVFCVIRWVLHWRRYRFRMHCAATSFARNFSHFWLNNSNANLNTIACRTVYRYSGACCCFSVLCIFIWIMPSILDVNELHIIIYITGSRVAVQSAILLSVGTAVNLLQLVLHIAAAMEWGICDFDRFEYDCCENQFHKKLTTNVKKNILNRLSGPAALRWLKFACRTFSPVIHRVSMATVTSGPYYRFHLRRSHGRLSIRA